MGSNKRKSNTAVECLKALGHMEAAADSYSKVVEMAPLHLEARLSLATLQQQLGRPDQALKALESMYDNDTLSQDSSAAQKVRSPAFLYMLYQCVCVYTQLFLHCVCRN